jgi:hypothetical protein
MMAEMDALQKNHLALEEHEAYEESEWAEDLVAQKKAKVEEQQRALKLAEEDLATANCTYHRIRYVPRGQRRGISFKTETTLHDRLSIREKWGTLNKLLKTVGKEERKLEYLDRPWRLENTDVPQAQVQEAPKETKGGDGLAKMSWARLYVPPPQPQPQPTTHAAPVPEKAEAEKVEPEAAKLTKSWPERWESWSRLHMPTPHPPPPPAPVSEVENTYVAAVADPADALRKEKASLKRQIRAFDEAFSKSYGRLPTNAEKEHLRPLYNRYRAIKKQIEDGDGDSPNAADASDTAAPQVQEPDYTYVPPPRVLDAEQYWPASRCRNLAKEVLREKPSRNHFGLIQQLSSHYKMTPEEFKRTNPFDLLKNTGILRKILNYREYSRMERARW